MAADLEKPQKSSHFGRSESTPAWYVTFEVPKTGASARRRNPRLTQMFETESDAKNFARTKFEEGLIVSAGTLNPHTPRQIISSTSLASWLEPEPEQ